MVVSDNSGMVKKLTALQHEFHQQLPDKIAEIKFQWQKLANAEPCEITLEDLHRMIHGLAGSGGTFGAEAISTTARELERRLMTFLKNPSKNPPYSKPDQLKIYELIKKLKQAIEEWEPSRIPYI